MAQEAQAQRRPRRGDVELDPSPMLAPFIRYLEESGFAKLCKEDIPFDLDVDLDDLDREIRLQALVLLANRFGLGSRYKCDRYIFGPCSGDLSGEARTLVRNRAAMYDSVQAAVPEGFRRGDFEGLVRGRDTDWLIAASSFAERRAYYPTRDRLIDALDGHHAAYTREYLSGVIDDLVGAGIVSGYR